METESSEPFSFFKDGYAGKILSGSFSRTLKGRLTEYIDIFTLFEATGTPAIPYIAAWEEKEKTIWYEYASRRFMELLGCVFSELAEVVKTRMVDRRTYRFTEVHGVHKEVLRRSHLEGIRDELRKASLQTGGIEAVYKVLPKSGDPIWLKDQAAIETYPRDHVCLSLGILTVVTKEMKAEEEREQLVSSLQDALSKVKTLQGLLPICASCKKIRDDTGYWNQIESYLEDHSDLSFSHSVCPECFKKLYPTFKQKEKSGGEK
ncbi:MAG: hypothetical protein JRJ54_09705 [Deltaproteobacteria bacterium]|nr:hypothetical protein [Deltaproteobacteria bacterium]